MLTFRSDDEKQTCLKGSLDDESFKYVRSWAAAEAFMDPTQFRVYVYGPNKVKNWINRLGVACLVKLSHTYRMKLNWNGLDMI